ncbi:G patch domain-containing protein 2-like isoform X1 [Centroberyx affinis]|uniref:G patch domain-containing protein 2-like isoform X1 n=1 Tax=Centroberyx affinis TaxID=166261 RepID=UPI003A5BF9BE
MMDELVQDLVSALEQTSEQTKLGELWEEMVLSPLQQRRQIRRRRGRKRRCDSSLYPLEHQRCLSEASESSLDEAAKDCRENAAFAAPSTTTASAANCSDSDDMIVTNRWHSFTGGSAKTRQHSWPESDSFTENTPGRPLRRRRKVKRMTSDVTVSLQQKLKVSGVDGKRGCSHRSSKKQRLLHMKKRSGWVGADRQAEGAGLMAKECWKDKITLEAKEQRDASDENMSEGETSSICSSDPGLYTNDEGRQGDDEQSDWFFEGDCGAGKGVAGLLPSWDSDSQLSLEDERPSPTFLQPARPSQRGYGRLNRLPGTAARCIRKGRRRLPSKDNSMPMFVERLKHFSQDPYQRNFWLPSIAKRDRSQFNPLCPLPVYPIGMVSESSHRRCSSSICKNRQTNVPLGLLCTGDIKRRRKTVAVAVTTSASNPFHKNDLGEEARAARNTLTPEAVGASGATSAAGPQPSTSDQPDLIQPESLFNPQGHQEEN